MKALLLAAGFGTRLRPITDSIPKCLVPVAGRPLMSYWLEILLKGKVISEIIINTHYLSKAVEKYVAENEYRGLIELVHEIRLLGTAGTVQSILPKIKKGDLFVAHADNLTMFDLGAFVERHQRRPKNCIATMMTFATDNPQSCGIVRLDEQGVVKDFHEKVQNPPGNLANAAVFILSPEALDIIAKLKKQETLDISVDVLPLLMGRLYTYHNDIYHRDIGTQESLSAADIEFPKIYQNYISRNFVNENTRHGGLRL